MTPQALVGLLADATRLRVFAAVLLGAGTVVEVAERTGTPVRAVAEALHRLTRGGLVQMTDGVLHARTEAFAQAARTGAASGERGMALPVDEDPDRARAAVLRSFVSDGRLVAIPAARPKRRVVLEHIVAAFEPGIRYAEREVGAILRAWHPDHASLRRYLVDEELLARDHGVYWRIGGPTI